MEIELDDEERQILRTILDSELADLRMEMSDTERKDFRDRLARRKAVIEKVIAALGA
ncbi:MAG TPA: hypothetical protein VIE68_08975 [Gemmatimonadota bacterium]|jgi:hypothetical protein